MKTKLAELGQSCWLLLTEVPGWSDAPMSVRLRRALPVAIPCMGMLGLAIWHFGFSAPRISRERELLQPLLALEHEIATLNNCSEQEFAELTEREGAATRLLLASPKDVGPFLAALKKDAIGFGWNASFQPADISNETPVEGAQVMYQPVRGKLTLAEGNPDPFHSLLSLLERVSASGKRIDLMKLAIRADDYRWHAVEVTLRLALPVVHEKTP